MVRRHKRIWIGTAVTAVVVLTAVGLGFALSGPGPGPREGGAAFVDSNASTAAATLEPVAGQSPSPIPTPVLSPSTPPSERAWPNASNTGVPAGWTPASTRTTDLVVTKAGAVIEDVRIVGASLVINAADVTVRRVEIQGGSINNFAGSQCRNGLLLEDVSVVRAPGQKTTDDGFPAIGAGGYTARRVKIDGRSEGFRVGGE